MMMNLARDLHRKGELDKIEAMSKLSEQIIGYKDMGSAYITEGYQGYDAFAIIPNRKEFVKYEGFVVFDLDSNKPVFIGDEEE
jgi:hypothetical protein